MQSAKGLNPFLFDADYGGMGGATDPAAAVNPFLSGFDSHVSTAADMGGAATMAPPVEINPFLSSYQPEPEPEPTYTTMTHDTVLMSTGAGVPATSAGATNPFASFVDASMDMGGPPPMMNDTQAMFGAAPPFSAPIDHGAALFGGPDLASTGGVAVEQLLDIQEDPVRPPSHNVSSTTRDLLDSVTGALEATSDSLLDRLRATQPSPVPQVIQPSPSPRSPSPDLLMGDDPPPPPPPSANPMHPSPGFNQVDNIMDMFDAPKSGPKSSQEILGLYNSTTTTTTNTAPKAENLLDLIDSFTPEPITTATESQEKKVEKIVTTAQENTPTEPPMLDLVPPTPPAKLIPEESAPPAPTPPQPVIDESPKTKEVEQVKATPQPMRPPPPPPAAKAPPERPKPPPPVQSPAAPYRPPSPHRPPSPQPTVTEVKAEPVHVEPVKVEPVPAEPVHVEPAHVEPAHVEPMHAEPVKLEPVAAPPPPEQRSPLPSRPPPPVPPAPRVSPQPPHVNAVEAPTHHIKSPSPPPITSKASTPSPTRPQQPRAPPQPVAPPAPAPAPPVSAPPPSPAPEPIFGKSSSITSSPFASTNATSSPFGAVNSTPAPRQKDAFASIFGGPPASASEPKQAPAFAAASAGMGDSFDAFDAKFSQAAAVPAGNAFGDAFGGATTDISNSGLDAAWGDGGGGFGTSDISTGFGTEGFDSFLSLSEPPPVPQSTPAKRSTAGDDDDFEADGEERDMSIVIKPKSDKDFTLQLAPALAPPPKSPAMSTGSAFSDDNTAFVPFLSSAKDKGAPPPPGTTMHRSESQDSPQTPLFEEDQSQPLEDYPRITYVGEGWEMHMRLPNKKKITGQRFWKKVFVKVGYQNDVPAVLIYNNKGEKDPFQEIPLQPCYSVSEISAQQFDQYGKVFTIKLQYIFYKERPGVRPGQLSKASRISDKLTQFAAYAIQGDYSGVKEFGSDLKKLGAPIEHSPQISQLCKLGVPQFEDVKQFSIWIEENLFRMSVHRDGAIHYKTEEIQVTMVDEYYVEQDIYGVVTRQIARVRLFFLSFLNGSAEIEMGVNDLRRQGKEIVGRHDIIPVPTEEWIRMEAIEFSNCVQLDEFESTQTIKFKPPDACYIELMRFRVRPPKHRELPLQVKTVFTVVGQRIDIRSDILVPGFTSRKLGQIPCEDVMVRFPIPEEWIYMFRVEKHFRYGSVKSAHRRSGKVKGIERFLGAVEAVEQSLMETTSGQAKYEHHHKAIVWRIPRLPKEGQGAYTTHSFFCHITLQAHEHIPENLTKHCYVEFTMPHTTISHTVCRSISVPSCDEPPEKCCRYLSRHEYVVEIEYSQGVTPATYTAAAAVEKPKTPPEEEKPMPGKAESDSDFSDDD